MPPVHLEWTKVLLRPLRLIGRSVMDPESVFRSSRTIPGCRSTITTIQPADSIEYCEADSVGAAVVVMSGRLQLECCSGEGACFDAGAVLFLTGLNLRHISNPGLEPLVLKTIRRDSRSSRLSPPLAP